MIDCNRSTSKKVWKYDTVKVYSLVLLAKAPHTPEIHFWFCVYCGLQLVYRNRSKKMWNQRLANNLNILRDNSWIWKSIEKVDNHYDFGECWCKYYSKTKRYQHHSLNVKIKILMQNKGKLTAECLNFANDCANHCLNWNFFLWTKSGTSAKESTWLCCSTWLLSVKIPKLEYFPTTSFNFWNVIHDQIAL